MEEYFKDLVKKSFIWVKKISIPGGYLSVVYRIGVFMKKEDALSFMITHPHIRQWLIYISFGSGTAVIRQ